MVSTRDLWHGRANVRNAISSPCTKHPSSFDTTPRDGEQPPSSKRSKMTAKQTIHPTCYTMQNERVVLAVHSSLGTYQRFRALCPASSLALRLISHAASSAGPDAARTAVRVSPSQRGPEDAVLSTIYRVLCPVLEAHTLCGVVEWVGEWVVVWWWCWW